ncbi:MAG: hypothetical protein VYE22_41245 [Myxococcota bacterium]|nr:hypothetical protein [Myxococcota bacterium]
MFVLARAASHDETMLACVEHGAPGLDDDSVVHEPSGVLEARLRVLVGAPARGMAERTSSGHGPDDLPLHEGVEEHLPELARIGRGDARERDDLEGAAHDGRLADILPAWPSTS